MKLLQFQTAAVTVLALSAAAHAVAKPLRIDQQGPDQALTAAQVAAHCRAAYASLQTYQITSTVTVHGLPGAAGKAEDGHSSATIQFTRPGKIHAEGTDTSGQPFAYVSNGAATVLKNLSTTGGWKKSASAGNSSGAEMAIAAVTGIAMDSATTVPALLLDTDPASTYNGWGVPLELGKGFTASGGDTASPFGKLVQLEMREDVLQGHPCYVLTAHSAALSGPETLWIDKQTFLLRRLVTDSDTSAQTITVGGVSQNIPAMKIHQEQSFTHEHLNEVLPDSTFTLPVAP